MVDERSEILGRIEGHRVALDRLEARLRAISAEPAAVAEKWPPRGFYLTYHVVAGLMIGLLGSLTSFLANVVGSLLVEQDPLLFLRAYGTVFLGPNALATHDLTFFMLVAVVHASVGAVAGAIFHVGLAFFVPERPALQIALGAAYGLLMWLVNLYIAIPFLQAEIWGEVLVLKVMPWWVAAVTHLIYGLTLGLLEPLGRFEPFRPAQEAA